MDITEQITSRMSELKLNASQVADELGMDPSTYYRKLATGGAKFTLAQLQQLADILKLSNEQAGKIFFGQ